MPHYCGIGSGLTAPQFALLKTDVVRLVQFIGRSPTVPLKRMLPVACSGSLHEDSASAVPNIRPLHTIEPVMCPGFTE